MRRSAILLTAFLLGASLSMAACGKKGDPEAPDANQFPHQYPTPEVIPETGTPGQPPPPPPPTPTPGYQPNALTPLNPQYP